MSRQRWYAPIAALLSASVLGLSSIAAAAEPTPAPSPEQLGAGLAASASSSPASSSPASSGGPTGSPSTPAAPATAPSAALTFGSTNARATMIAFSWTEVVGAAGYRLSVATSSRAAPLTEVHATRPVALVSGLKPHTRYFAVVTALAVDGAPLGDPSDELKVTTPYPRVAPVVQPTVTSSVAITLSWVKPARGTTLQLEWKAPGAKAKVTEPKTTRLVKSSLKADTRYRVRARLVHGRTVLSAWSRPVTATTPDGDPLRVASYNVQCANCRAWGPRRQGVADTILSQNLDVVGLQEASAADLKPSNRSQFEDLARLLEPGGFRFVNLTRYNCRRQDTAKKCRPVERGASGSDRIAYRTSTLRLISQGARLLTDVPGTGKDRYIAWAVFEHKINGKRFLFTSTHLEPRTDTGGSTIFHNLRRAQTQQVVRTIESVRNGLPVVAVGDFNSTKWNVPSNAPYDLMRAAGFVDPLGNAYRSTGSAPGATVENRINTQYLSYNKLELKARRTDGINGANLDYIFVSPMRVTEWETVVSVNAAGRFTSMPPSDHNLIRATVLLP